jgi:hypothetical protein
VRLSPSVETTSAPTLGGTRLAPREPVPEGSSMPDLGDGGGRAARGTTLLSALTAYEDPSVSGARLEVVLSV